MKLFEKFKMDLVTDSRNEYKKAVLSLLEEDKDAFVLDLGCGDTRRLTIKIALKIGTGRIFGIDIEESSTSLPVILKGDLNEPLPPEIGSNQVDIVIASQIIEHLWNTDGFLKEIYRVLKPTGYAIISTPNLASWHNVVYLMLGKQPEVATVSDELYPRNEKPGHRRIFTATELIKLLEFHGFIVKEVIKTSYYPFIGWLAKLMCKLDWKHSSMITVKVGKQ